MTARRVAGVCPQGGRLRIRHRNQKSALAELDSTRQAARRAGIPAELWPTTVYRCPSKQAADGPPGCGGWHVATCRAAQEEFLRGTLRGRPAEPAFAQTA